MKQSPLPWVTRWFQERVPGAELSPETDFYQAKLIDSFAFVELLGDIQEVFSVRLEFSDLGHPSAKTMRGLAELIERKLGNG